MARLIDRLSARQVATEKRIGRHADGRGLYLVLTPNNGKRWVFIYSRNGKRHEMGLGSVHDVSLAEARAARDAARKLLTRSTLGSGQPRSTSTPSRCSASWMSLTWTWLRYFGLSSPFGQPSPKQRAGYAVASRRCCHGLRRGNIATGTTRLAGAGTSTRYCRHGARCSE